MHDTPPPVKMEEGEVAESNRRGERAVDEHLEDEELDDALDPVDDDGAVSTRATSNGRAGAPARRAGDRKSVKADRAVKIGDERQGLGSRIARFVREVVAELRKVNWPSRKELLTYASVVIVFVVVMMTIVGLLDYGFAWVVGHVFG
jgi:preprotein translocase subunit SecE